MDDVLESLSGYPTLFALCALSGPFVPVPEDALVVYAGLQIDLGLMDWGGALPVAFAGVLLRDSMWFFVGRWVGEPLLRHRWVLRLFGESKLERARATVAERGGTAVLAGRFSVGFRVTVFAVAGALGVRPREFFLWDGLGLLVTVPVLLFLGRTFGRAALDGVVWVVGRAPWVLVVIALVAGGWLWWRRRRSSAR